MAPERRRRAQDRDRVRHRPGSLAGEVGADGHRGLHHRPVRIADFALERYFARWEFAVRHVLGASDVEGWPLAELLELADDETSPMWNGLRLGYTESTGHPKLRAQIAGLYDSLEADDVLVFAGAEEAVFCLFNTSVTAGDHVIVTWPGYQSLYEVARAAGAHVSLHALREDDGWSLDVDRLIRSFRPRSEERRVGTEGGARWSAWP